MNGTYIVVVFTLIRMFYDIYGHAWPPVNVNTEYCLFYVLRPRRPLHDREEICSN